MTYIKRFLPLLFLISLATLPIFPENIRGEVAGIVDVDGSREQTVTGKLESLVGIRISDNLSPLVQGIKVTVVGNKDLSLYRNSFALYFYQELDNPPSEKLISYQGTQAYMRFLDFEQSISFLIPLTSAHTLSPDRSSYIVSEEDKSKEFPFLLTILPITKGIPDNAYNQEVTFTVSPVYFNKGSLRLKILDNEGNPTDEMLYVQIDGKMVQDIAGPQILEAGLHTMVIRSDTGVEETLQFSLSPGENLVLDHVLQLQYPTLKIDTLEGMSVFLDGKPVNESDLSQYFEIDPGSHLILFELGDYQLSREFNAEMQGSYRITMIPEILVEQQQ